MNAYLARTLVGIALPDLAPTPVDPTGSVHLDVAALRALEIREPGSEHGAGALVRTVARTVTRPGRRLLVERLSASRPTGVNLPC